MYKAIQYIFADFTNMNAAFKHNHKNGLLIRIVKILSFYFQIPGHTDCILSSY